MLPSPFTYGSFDAPPSDKQENVSSENLNTSTIAPEATSRQITTPVQEENTITGSYAPRYLAPIKLEPKDELSHEPLDLSVPPPDLTLVPRPSLSQAACMPRSAYLDLSVSETSEFFGPPMMMLSGNCLEFLSSPNPQLHLVIGVSEGENVIGSLFFGNEAACHDERILSFFKIKHAISPCELLNPIVPPNLHLMRVPYYDEASSLNLSFGYIWESIHQCRMTGSNVLVVGHPFSTAAMVCILSYIMTRYHTTLNSVLSAFASLSIFPHLQSFEISALLKLEMRVNGNSPKQVIKTHVPTAPNAKTHDTNLRPFSALPSPLPHPQSPSSPSETEFQVFSDFILEVRLGNASNPRRTFEPHQVPPIPPKDCKFLSIDNLERVKNGPSSTENPTDMNLMASSHAPRLLPKKDGLGRRGYSIKRKGKGRLFKKLNGQEKFRAPRPPIRNLDTSQDTLRITLRTHSEQFEPSACESSLRKATWMQPQERMLPSPITLVQPNSGPALSLPSMVPQKGSQSEPPSENIKNAN